MRDPITIRLGETILTVRPLTVRQVRDIQGLLLKQSGVDPAIDIIKIGVSRDHTADGIDDIEGVTVTEIAAAGKAILEMGGFMPGEVKAPDPESPLNGVLSSGA